MAAQRIHIVGASGSGTTTLGAALAQAMDVPHQDSDHFFWLPTEPPFTTQRPQEDRLPMLKAALPADGPWVISGSLLSWGLEVVDRFDLVVFLYLDPEIRMARSLARERGRYGPRIGPGGDMHETHQKFMTWSGGYDDGSNGGRSLASHRSWLSGLTCPVLEITDAPTVEESVRRVLAF
ncbi:AAA family ATPase [Phenylobacterium ferrooxidans]|uniref:Adenylate kinase n=1 Tax=Phenylobacterium ferrooxidans TaxID=2982689 RepID=A0ABW6CPJ6_9CAUL